MKTSCFSNSQIIAIIKQAEAGSPAPKLGRKHERKYKILALKYDIAHNLFRK